MKQELELGVTTKTLKSEKDSIIFQPTMGKPDHAAEYTLDSAFQRPRVDHAGQQGPTCYYTALKRIRFNPGRLTICPQQLKEARILEKKFSKYRKRQDAISQKYHELSKQISAFKSLLPPLKSIPSKLFCAFLLELNSPVIQLDSDFKSDLVAFVKSEHTTLDSYIEEVKTHESIKAVHSFFSDVGADPLSSIPGTTQLSNAEFSQFSLKKQNLAMQDAALFYFMSNFPYLQYGQWSPLDDVQQLIKTLRAHGPCLFAGDLGPAYYETSAKQLRVESNFPIYYWPKGSKQQQQQSASHMLNIVGAEVVNSRGYVYFTDPNDPSPASDPTGHKIYCVSYDRFKEGVRTLDGVKGSTHAPHLCYSEHRKKGFKF